MYNDPNAVIPPRPQEVYEEIKGKSGREIANIALNLYFKIRGMIYSQKLYLNATTGTSEDGFNICLPRKVMFIINQSSKAYFVYWGKGDWDWRREYIDINDPKSIDEIIDVFRRKASEDKPSSQGQSNSIK